ncbi:hypothetical protein KCP74_16470 [Salmonella enterica subsp. enterica]|nr:hypothetical protein KCP74_16470 [Salmonella enterica subsp. enterica]
MLMSSTYFHRAWLPVAYQHQPGFAECFTCFVQFLPVFSGSLRFSLAYRWFILQRLGASDDVQLCPVSTASGVAGSSASSPVGCCFFFITLKSLPQYPATFARLTSLAAFSSHGLLGLSGAIRTSPIANAMNARKPHHVFGRRSDYRLRITPDVALH